MQGKRLAVGAIGLILVAAMGAEPTPLNGFDRFVNEDGSFSFPGDSAREGLVPLGSWFVPEGPASGFHHVFTQAEAVELFRATGRFPDGTVLLKEIWEHARGNYTTGTDVASATRLVQWFLMVKDTRGRYPDRPLWQEGWGWGLFQADDPTRNTAKSFAQDCQACHLPARETDWVYTNGYPALKRLETSP